MGDIYNTLNKGILKKNLNRLHCRYILKQNNFRRNFFEKSHYYEGKHAISCRKAIANYLVFARFPSLECNFFLEFNSRYQKFNWYKKTHK